MPACNAKMFIMISVLYSTIYIMYNYASVRKQGIYDSVFVCVFVCLCRLLQLLKDHNEVQIRVSIYRLPVMFS